MDLNTLVAALPRAGKTTAKKMEGLGIKTVGDLLYHFPFRYEDFRKEAKIKELKPDDTVTVRGRINLIANRRSFRTKKIVTEALLDDGNGTLRIVWFNQPFLTRVLKIGDSVALSGKVSGDMLGAQMVSPTWEKIKANKTETTNTGRLVPVYSLAGNLTEKQLRYFITQVLPVAETIREWLPTEILEKEDLVPIYSAIRGAHFPVDEKDLAANLKRLKFDELFLLQLRVAIERYRRIKEKAPSLQFKEVEIKEFVSQLPFTLTKAQKIAAWEILQDLEKTVPMNRLLSGDVGSGKTVVAAMAAIDTALNGFQTAFMAPTEILASQHYQSLVKILGNKAVIGLLTRSQFAANANAEGIKKKELIEAIGLGNIEIVVGTHALLTEKVEFKNLGLVVVDEQHRFGVEQRKTLKEKSSKKMAPHFLSMTATPIPRSLALTIYGDLDLSVINEMPAGRRPILTRLVDPINRLKAYGFIREQIKKGRQAFVVCPLIAGDVVTGGKRSVQSEYEKLSKEVYPDLKVGYLHGKMKGAEKEEIMGKFKNKEIDILISTAVVEVGVNIPNASVMLIEGAESFGLAQLHQFRGRVGRSVHQSYCFLFTENANNEANERLKFFEKNLDGFKLAEHDLEKRGPGEVYGIEQSGFNDLRLAKLTDYDIIKPARNWANRIVGNIDKYPAVKEKININKKVHWE